MPVRGEAPEASSEPTKEFNRCKEELTLAPHVTIFIIALIGLLVHGVIGFFAWGALGFVLILIISLLMRGYSGGVLPRDMREQTVINFISAHPEECRRAYPGKSAYDVNRTVTNLLEQFAKQAVKTNPSRDLGQAYESNVFLPAAQQVMRSKEREGERELADKLITYLRTDPHWYG